MEQCTASFFTNLFFFFFQKTVTIIQDFINQGFIMTFISLNINLTADGCQYPASCHCCFYDNLCQNIDAPAAPAVCIRAYGHVCQMYFGNV